MLFHITVIFVCQLIGEALVTGLGLPVPGPVIGMALLFVALLVRGGIPDGLGEVGDTILRNLSLLFIPAGVGVMLHASLLRDEILPISAALSLSTILAIAVTGLSMSWFLRNRHEEPSK